MNLKTPLIIICTCVLTIGMQLNAQTNRKRPKLKTMPDCVSVYIKLYSEQRSPYVFTVLGDSVLARSTNPRAPGRMFYRPEVQQLVKPFLEAYYIGETEKMMGRRMDRIVMTGSCPSFTIKAYKKGRKVLEDFILMNPNMYYHEHLQNFYDAFYRLTMDYRRSGRSSSRYHK